MIKYNNCNGYTILQGCIKFEDGSPVIGAVVILESINNFSNYNSIDSSITNILGEFCFLIYNKNIDYKLKIFNNNETCKLNLY